MLYYETLHDSLTCSRILNTVFPRIHLMLAADHDHNRFAIFDAGDPAMVAKLPTLPNLQIILHLTEALAVLVLDSGSLPMLGIGITAWITEHPIGSPPMTDSELTAYLYQPTKATQN
ncbi:hypothetical protein LCGC14_1151070 [marine sediment metagenome]|uniref:Uncharacterized protein n=1 Tax=marine sediment metagenome TaxID=412755 RepID=A0A0F9MIM7_9ZZZZ